MVHVNAAVWPRPSTPPQSLEAGAAINQKVPNPRSSASRRWSERFWECYGIGFAFSGRMMDLAISVLALVAGALTLEIYAAARVPLGYQDELGFHQGPESPPKVSDCQAETLS